MDHPVRDLDVAADHYSRAMEVEEEISTGGDPGGGARVNYLRMGEGPFAAAVREQLDDESAGALLALLGRSRPAQGPGETATP